MAAAERDGNKVDGILDTVNHTPCFDGKCTVFVSNKTSPTTTAYAARDVKIRALSYCPQQANALVARMHSNIIHFSFLLDILVSCVWLLVLCLELLLLTFIFVLDVSLAHCVSVLLPPLPPYYHALLWVLPPL